MVEFVTLFLGALITEPAEVRLQVHRDVAAVEIRLDQRAEVTFGGRYGDTVSSELTAFPVLLEPRGELPAVEEMQGWFRAAGGPPEGRPLRVHTAEKGTAEIVVVLSPSARQYLRPGPRPDGKPIQPLLSKDHRLRFVGANPVVVERDQGPFVVFPRSPEVGPRVVGLRRILSTVDLPAGPPEEARICDAVAVAGLFAHQSGRRRAVVLVATGEPADASQFDPRRVRSYLGRIGVPLRVWTPVKGDREAGRWGAAVNISTDALLDSAYRELDRELDRQRVVWLSGSYLPQDLAVDPGVAGVRALR